MNSFNLVTEPWIPLQGGRAVSLAEVFEEPNLPPVAGNPIEKLAVFKLLLAVGQAAFTPEDEESWAKSGVEIFAAKCVDYLETHHDKFFLYGDKPFLQFPQLKGRCRNLSLASLLPYISSGNTTILFNSQLGTSFTDAQKAILLVSQMGFGFGGKKPDSSVILTAGFTEKSKSAKSGPNLGFMGFLHSHWIDAGSLVNSVWLNIFSKQAAHDYLNKEIGTAPWENQPNGEDCLAARQLKHSYMGRLIPVSRFCLVEQDNILITEGLQHPSYLEGVSDPSITVKPAKPKPKILWVNPELKPWRQLPALLSFLGKEDASFECKQLKFVASRFRFITEEQLTLWSTGTAVSSNAGEQYLTGKNDFVDSMVALNLSALDTSWYVYLNAYFTIFEETSSKLYGCVARYYKEMSAEGAAHASRCSSAFWINLESRLDDLLHLCQRSTLESEEAKSFVRMVQESAFKLYDEQCPKGTARQIQSWAKNRPNFSISAKTKSTKAKKGVAA